MKLIASILCRRRYKVQFKLKRWFFKKKEKKQCPSKGCAPNKLI